MNEELKNLILAIVTSVKERESFVTKTKLLKLLYLFDVEYYRIHKKTYTGLDWTYFYLGPWTAQYDPVIEKMVANDYLVASGNSRIHDATFFKAATPFDSRYLFGTYKDQSIFNKLINNFGDKDTADILDYVYFKTEPMVRGIRYEMLDFSTINESPAKEYKRPASGKSKAEIAEFKDKIKQKLEAKKRDQEAEQTKFTPPNYDEDFFKAMQIMEDSI